VKAFLREDGSLTREGFLNLVGFKPGMKKSDEVMDDRNAAVI